MMVIETRCSYGREEKVRRTRTLSSEEAHTGTSREEHTIDLTGELYDLARGVADFIMPTPAQKGHTVGMSNFNGP